MTDRKKRLASVSVAGLVVLVAITAVSARISSWWFLPAMLTWASGLITAAAYDLATQRIPTRVVWSAAVATAVLVALAALVTGVWQPAIAAAAVAAASGLILGLCWRFLGLGFGDVRLGILGGLGLGHADVRAIFAGIFMFAVIVAIQAVIVYRRTRNRRATFPMAPALAAGFVTAAIF